MTYQTNKYIASLSDKTYQVKQYGINQYQVINKQTKEDFYCSHEEISSMSLYQIENLRMATANHVLDYDFNDNNN